jgi:uroporphyrinogen-III synthase
MMRSPALLWATRSSPFNLLTAQRLRGMGHGVLVVPLFEIRALTIAPIKRRPDLIAFTSVNGVRHHPYRHDWSAVPVVAVGGTTAAAARRCGYRDVRSAGGNVQDLQALILRSVPTGKRLVHFSAKEPAGDLVRFLRDRCFDAIGERVYETIARPLPQVRGVLASEPRVAGIVIHSPKGARRIAELIAETGWRGAVFCISPACAIELRGIPGLSVHSSPRPTERALMETIRQATTVPVAASEYWAVANDNIDYAPTPA